MTNEEIKLRNITIDDKLKEMEKNLEKLRLTYEELVRENKDLNDKY